MKASLKYWLLQVPGYILLGGLLYFLWGLDWLSPGTAAFLFGLWVAKDLLLFPLYRPALEGTVPAGSEALVGRQGRAVTEIDARSGLVLIDGERWRARTRDGEHLDAHSPVRVVAAEGLTLVVSADPNGT